MRWFQPPPPFFKAPIPSLSSLFKIFVSPPLFSVPPPFKVFQTVAPTPIQPPLTLIQHTNLPYIQLMSLNKYQKGDFNSSTVAFYQKSIFDFLNPFTNMSGYLNLWDIFRFIFRFIDNLE